MFKLIFRNKLSLILTAFVVATSVGLQLTIPILLQGVLDNQAARNQVIAFFLVSYIGVSAISYLVSILTTSQAVSFAWTCSNALRTTVVTRVLQQRSKFFEGTSCGNLVERIDGDLAQITQFLSGSLFSSIVNIVLILGALTIVFSKSVILGFCFMAATLLTFVMIYFLQQSKSSTLSHERNIESQITGNLSRWLLARRELSNNRGRHYVNARAAEMYQRLLVAKIDSQKYLYKVWVSALVLSAGFSALALGVSGALNIANQLSVGEVYLVVMFSAMLRNPLENFQNSYSDFMEARASLARIRELETLTTEPDAALVAFPEQLVRINFENVDFTYSLGSVSAVGGFFLEVLSGETLGLAGKSGSGKSTLARLLCKQIDPSRGRITFNKIPLTDISLTEVRKNVCYVGPVPHVFSGSILDNLSVFGPVHKNSEGGSIRAKVVEFFGMLPQESVAGLLDLDCVLASESCPVELGQRLVLLRLLFSDAPLIILDEAFASVDQQFAEVFLARIRQMRPDRIIVVISHQNRILELCDRTVDLSSRELRVDDSHPSFGHCLIEEQS